jgi:hypothetical protein
MEKTKYIVFVMTLFISVLNAQNCPAKPCAIGIFSSIQLEEIYLTDGVTQFNPKVITEEQYDIANITVEFRTPHGIRK